MMTKIEKAGQESWQKLSVNVQEKKTNPDSVVHALLNKLEDIWFTSLP